MNAWGNNKIILFPRQQAVMVDTTNWIHLVCHVFKLGTYFFSRKQHFSYNFGYTSY